MAKITKDLAEQKLHDEMFEDFIESVKENLEVLCNIPFDEKKRHILGLFDAVIRIYEDTE